MGMLIEGKWVAEAERFIENGAFVRETSAFDLDPSVVDMCALEAEPGRFRLIASRSCPWSHQTLLVRVVKGLERLLPMVFAGEPRIEGYAVRDEEPPQWSGVQHLRHVHQLYTLSDPCYSGRATVPLLWDTGTGRNPHGIVAEAPAADWSADHDRARLGPAQIWSEGTGPATVETGECERAQ